MSKEWREADLLYLKGNYRKMRIGKIAKDLKRTIPAIIKKCKALDL